MTIQVTLYQIIMNGKAGELFLNYYEAFEFMKTNYGASVETHDLYIESKTLYFDPQNKIIK